MSGLFIANLQPFATIGEIPGTAKYRMTPDGIVEISVDIPGIGGMIVRSDLPFHYTTPQFHTDQSFVCGYCCGANDGIKYACICNNMASR